MRDEIVLSAGIDADGAGQNHNTVAIDRILISKGSYGKPKGFPRFELDALGKKSKRGRTLFSGDAKAFGTLTKLLVRACQENGIDPWEADLNVERTH